MQQFLAGQWLDLFCPGISKAGGFTITSMPSQAHFQRTPRSQLRLPLINLAVQYSPKNPPAAWLWKPVDEILYSVLNVRIGGNFTWPPPDIPPQARRRVLLVAGGVGINPLISILNHLTSVREPLESIKMLYGSKSSKSDLSDVLFLPKIAKTITRETRNFGEKNAKLFVTPSDTNSTMDYYTSSAPEVVTRRMTHDDLLEALGDDIEKRQSTVIYVCGPQAMTDEFVETIKHFDGVRSENVLCEKWW